LDCFAMPVLEDIINLEVSLSAAAAGAGELTE
jgi:hypothetical protein